MRVALFVGVVMLAGCGSSGGVELVITPPSNVDRIALYVGIGEENKQQLAPPGFGQTLSTSTWVRDPHNELSQVKSVAGNEVTFGLLGPADPLSIVIAVGFDAAGNVVAAAVLPKDQRPLTVPNTFLARYRLTLEPVKAADPQAELDARVWKPRDPAAPGEQAECVIAIGSGEKLAVVADGDADCDAWPTEDRTKECLPAVFMGTRNPRLDSSIDCLLPTTVTADGNTTPAAVLGGKKCVDGTGSVDGCFQSNYCLPKSVYESCLTSGGFSCAQDIAAHSIMAPTHMQCFIHNDGMGNLCTDPIPGIDDPRGLIDTHMCKGGSARITRPGQNWSTQVTFGEPGGVTFQITLASPTTDCRFTLTPSGTITSGTPNTGRYGALIAGDLDNGRGIAMPYELFVDLTRTGCGSPEPCTLVYTQATFADGTFQCMNSAPL